MGIGGQCRVWIGLVQLLVLVGLTTPVSGQVILTKVVPGVTTAAGRGDTVELYNSGATPVNLTDWILTDLDPGSVHTSLTNEATFAPASLNVPDLGPGQFAVVVFSSNGTTSASYTLANFGLIIQAPVGAGFLGSETDQVLLADGSASPQDFVAWWSSSVAPTADDLADLGALTPATAGYGLTQGSAAWGGPDSVTLASDYESSAVDFSAFAGTNTYGLGGLRRVSTAGVFSVGSPDSKSQWQAVSREQIYLGSFTENLPTTGGLQPRRMTGNITQFLLELDSSNSPERRIARDADQDPPDFQPASNPDLAQWNDVILQALGGQWPEAFSDASSLGYEVVEFLDVSTTAPRTYHILRETAVPGEVGFRGMGVFVFPGGPGVRDYFVLQAPHPRFDSGTLDQAAVAIPQVLPRAFLVAGTHRNNHPTTSTCDGTFAAGQPYRISDVAHHPANFFHQTHLTLHGSLSNSVFVQLHGFCCPGGSSYPLLTDDVVLSNGTPNSPGISEFTRLWAQRIHAQNFFTDDGNPGGDLTTVAIYPDQTNELGGTNNLQGRVVNGVPPTQACDTPSTTTTGRFIHIEQDPDVREEPQHIITALQETLDHYQTLIPVVLSQFGAD